MRLVAIDLAHVEGFNRAVNNVSLRRLVSFGMSPSLKGAFEQVYGPPYIVKMLLAELGDDPQHDSVVKLDYDGSMGQGESESTGEWFEVLAGTEEAERKMAQFLADQNGDSRRSFEKALQLAAQAWAVGMEAGQRSSESDGEETGAEKIDAVKVLKEHLKARHIEAAVLERNRPASSKFRLLDEKELRPALKDL